MKINTFFEISDWKIIPLSIIQGIEIEIQVQIVLKFR